MRASASLSHDRKFRFTLDRAWDEALPMVVFVMLNPSTADEREDDPTIRRCIGFARFWGYGALRVVNLHPLRTPSPDELRGNLNDIDRATVIRNREAIREAFSAADKVILAWGCQKKRGYHWARPLSWGWDLTDKQVQKQFVLAETADLCPRHPLYVKGDTQPRRREGWQPEAQPGEVG